MTARAERSETSCSPDRPPKITPTRILRSAECGVRSAESFGGRPPAALCSSSLFRIPHSPPASGSPVRIRPVADELDLGLQLDPESLAYRVLRRADQGEHVGAS